MTQSQVLSEGGLRSAKVPVWVRARAYTVEALGVIVKAMRDESLPIDKRAEQASRLLDRGWGRAPIMVSGDVEHNVKFDVRSLPRETLPLLERALLQMLGPAAREAIAREGQVIEGEVVENDSQPVTGEGK